MSYKDYKTKQTLKKLKRKQQRSGNRYVGALVTAANRNAMVEEFGTSYYDMYKQEMDKEREQFEADGSPEDYVWRFPQISEEELTKQSIAYGREIVIEKKKSLRAYINGKTHYRWKGEVRPVMTSDYLLQNEKLKEIQQKRAEAAAKVESPEGIADFVKELSEEE